MAQEKKETKVETKAEKKEVKGKTLGTICPACNASIKFNAKVNKWKCDYCGSEFTLEEMEKVTKSSASKENNSEKPEKINLDDYVSYHCEACGAEIIADEQTAATFCVYCGNTAILKNKLSGNFAPTRIIPFRTEKALAEDKFKSLAKGRPLVPKAFTNIKNIEKIRGIYIPFWLYDFKVHGNVMMNAKRVTSWTSGDTHYTKTDTFQVIREGSMNFYDIPVDASTRFDNDIMNTLEPFNYEDLVAYNHAYLSGFYAEKSDENEETALKEAAHRAGKTTKDIMIDSAVGYTTKTVTSENLDADLLDREYVLLPVWMVNVKYANKQYTFAMNGQTGEFIGNIPIDKVKLILYTIFTFVITFVVAMVVSYIIFKLGGN